VWESTVEEEHGIAFSQQVEDFEKLEVSILLQTTLIPIRRLIFQKHPRSIRTIDLKPLILANQLASRIPTEIMHQGRNSMDFLISLGKSWNLGSDDEAEEHGALDVVESEIGRVCLGVGECFGDEWGVWDGDAGEEAGWERGHVGDV
jgi:hypothetical protein